MKFKAISNLTNGSIYANHYGDYAGKYSSDAYEVFESLGMEQDDDDMESWQDIHADEDGNIYAVWGDSIGVTRHVQVEES